VSKPPIVLHFIETDIPGGAESMLIDLCRLQKRAGLVPIIAHFDHPYFSQRCEAEGISSFALPPRSLFKSMITLPVFCMRFARLMRQANVSLLHSHLFGPIIGGSLAAKMSGVPHVGTLHDIHMIEDSPQRIYQMQLALALGTRLIAVSNQMRDFYRSRLYFFKDRVDCIHNAVFCESKASIARGELLLSDDDLVIAIVGRLVALKRTQDAILAIKKIRCNRPIKLLVIGDGPERNRLEVLAKNLGLESTISFLGMRNDVPALLEIADLFIQCSETEGLSISILEALHAGLACIVSDVGGNRELVVPGDNGLLFPAGDIPALVEQLQNVVAFPDLLRRYGERSKEISKQKFSVESHLNSYRRLYGSLGV